MQRQQMRQNQKEHQVFQCGTCFRQPFEPVVTQCGHIFCWRCIYKVANTKFECSICRSILKIQNCYPIFIQHQQRQISEQDHPTRPSPNYRQKIINPGVSSSNLPAGLTHLENNIEIKKPIPGPNYIPCMAANTFNKINQPKNNDKDASIYKLCRQFTTVLCGLFICAVVIVLFV